MSQVSAAGPYAQLATVERNGFEESRHFGSLVALDSDGSIVAELGAPQQPILPRSSIKPIQALASLASGAALAGPALAIAAGSHTGEDEHVAVVREVLNDSGLTDEALGCPPDMPEDVATKRRLICAGTGPQRVRMNCSGKHAGMLAACVAAGWPTETYLEPSHPLQQRIAQLVSERAGEAIAHTAIDGCGAPLLGTSLLGLARAIHSLAIEEPGTPGRAIIDAMREHPFYVAGTGHPNTEIMRKVPGLVCKGGAEGVIVAATASGHTVAAKVIDGSSRATTSVLLAALEALGENTSGAADLTSVTILGGGQPVGSIHASEQVAAAIGAGRSSQIR